MFTVDKFIADMFKVDKFIADKSMADILAADSLWLDFYSLVLLVGDSYITGQTFFIISIRTIRSTY